MATASVSGLVSGLDTATIISQLMQVEAQPQTLLKSKVSSEQSSLGSLQSLNSKLQTIATKAGDLAKMSAWAPFTAISSSDKVVATVTSGATASSFAFTVKQTAKPHQVAFANSPLTTRVTSPGSTMVRLTTADGAFTDLETGDGTLNGLTKALNASGTGVHATTLQLSDGTSRLLVQSENTGAGSSFTLTNTDGSDLALDSTPTPGQDALIMVGGDELRSSTNAFKGTVSGLDLTLAASTPPGTVVDVTVTRDTKAMTDAVQGMVDAANSVLSDLGTLTSYNTTTKKSGALAGDPTLRALRQELLSGVANGVDNKSLADVGIQLDRYGKVTFDAEKFTAAYTADPTGTARRFAGTAEWSQASVGSASLSGFTWRSMPGTYAVDATSTPPQLGGDATLKNGVLTGRDGAPVSGLAVAVSANAQGDITFHQGFAAKLAAIAGRASDSTAGTVTAAINGRNSAIDSLNDAIDRWDTRLTKRRESLERQYAALEVALGKLQDQSSWLSSQIAGLPSSSSSS